MQFNEFLKNIAEQTSQKIDFTLRPSKFQTASVQIGGLELQKHGDLTLGERACFTAIDNLIQNQNVDILMSVRVLAAKASKELGIEDINDAESIILSPQQLLSKIEAEIQLLTQQLKTPAKVNRSKELKELKQKLQHYKDTLKSQAYIDFIVTNTKEYQRIAEISQVTADTNAINWIKLTIFLQSRYQEDWTFSDTANIPMPLIKELLKFLEDEQKQDEPNSPVNLPTAS